MEKIIMKIIDLEHEAQNLVAEGLSVTQKIKESTLEECNQMETHILEMAENKMKQLHKKSAKETEDRIIRIYEDTALKMRLMEENAEENQKKWEEEIFNRVIRG